MNAKILEVFRSIQGEGQYAGVPQVFVRFFECNMHCVWCDTPASIGDTKRHYQDIDGKALLAQVDALYEGCHSVSITGGEPLLQDAFLKSFCRQLKRSGKKVYLDTNGTLPQALKNIIKEVDIIAMDIKLPSSTKQRAFWAEHKEFLKVASHKEVFVKVVVSLGTQAREVLKAAQLVAAQDRKIPFFLQPNHLDLKREVMAKCLEYQKSCAKIIENVRILPQVHKFMRLK